MDASAEGRRAPLPIPCVELEPGFAPSAGAYEGDAGFDLRAACDMVLRPFERASVPCGTCVAIPEGHAGLVLPRSGLAARHGISLVNAPGLIDSGYRGEVCAVVVNLDAAEEFAIRKGDRIAQLLVIEVPAVRYEVVEGLEGTERAAKGFGSSGTR